MIIVNTQQNAAEHSIDLRGLSVDLRRMLRIQWKEWIHSIEDRENEHECYVSDDLIDKAAA